MSEISFGRTAYVAGTPAAMIDAIESNCNVSMTGTGMVCIDWDDLPQENPGEDDSVEAYLWKTRIEILKADGGDRLVGDVIFVN